MKAAIQTTNCNEVGTKVCGCSLVTGKLHHHPLLHFQVFVCRHVFSSQRWENHWSVWFHQTSKVKISHRYCLPTTENISLPTYQSFKWGYKSGFYMIFFKMVIPLEVNSVNCILYNVLNDIPHLVISCILSISDHFPISKKPSKKP